MDMGCSNRSKQHPSTYLHALTFFENLSIPDHRRRARVNGDGVVGAATLDYLREFHVDSDAFFHVTPFAENCPFGLLVVGEVMMRGITLTVRCSAVANKASAPSRFHEKRSLSSLERSSARAATRKNDTRKWDMRRKQVLGQRVAIWENVEFPHHTQPLGL